MLEGHWGSSARLEEARKPLWLADDPGVEIGPSYKIQQDLGRRKEDPGALTPHGLPEASLSGWSFAAVLRQAGLNPSSAFEVLKLKHKMPIFLFPWIGSSLIQ